ncbi:hypothetical protein ELE36_09325 [Pseudolysobacter antarcticus]|uniref:Glycosyltransferase RgtA/B/C/D-like domain-containing protein n=1 Tax=Pseudolysobacter antarcticus TaxID=2511995 RepID=A0A411HJ81_9GAMM|nr:hypothetical protein [Pseudolysobacter antarcticus]QBB70548.1 hypothetical protein ELE36_09325 [Pseudolysobacter antarcticus]
MSAVLDQSAPRVTRGAAQVSARVPVQVETSRSAQLTKLLPGLLLGLVMIKLIVLLIDPNVHLFLGDSASYLYSAVNNNTPPDRSFTYPLMIFVTAVRSESLFSLLLLQTGFGVATCTLLFLILYLGLEVRAWIAMAAGLLLCIEPSQLFYERMVMTESASSFHLLAALACGTAYLRSGKLRWLILCVLIGTVLASLRAGLVPFALAVAPAAVLIGALYGVSKRRHVWIVHLLLVLLVTDLCHDAYRAWYGRRAGGEPAYILDAPLFRLGLVAPLVRPEHFAGTGVDPAILHEVTIPLDNQRLREEQIWVPGGLIPVLRAHVGDQRARQVAAILAKRAVADNPLGVARLGITTLPEYFDPPRREIRMLSDLGSGQIPDEKILSLLREWFHYDAAKIALHHSPIKDLFAYSAYWLIFCLFALAPIGLALARLGPHRVPAVVVLVTACAVGLMVGQVLCSHIISFRYLHPFPILLLLVGAGLTERLLERHDVAEKIEQWKNATKNIVKLDAEVALS